LLTRLKALTSSGLKIKKFIEVKLFRSTQYYSKEKMEDRELRKVLLKKSKKELVINYNKIIIYIYKYIFVRFLTQVIYLSNNSNNSITKNLRIENSLLSRIDEYLGLHNQKFSSFVREAVVEKLNRSSVEENLEITVNTSDIQQILNDNNENIDKKLRYFQDEIKSVNERINPKLDSILNGLTHIIASQQLGETPEITAKPSLDNQILSTLPKDINDLYLEFDDIDAVNDAINRLLQAKKIIEENNKWMAV